MSQNNINEDLMIEKIKIANLKHAGNLIEVIRETGYSPEMVRKMVRKIRLKEEHEEANLMIADTLWCEIKQGHNQRTIYFQEMLNKLEGSEIFFASDCCRMPTKIEKDSNDVEVLKCRSCGIECKTVKMNQMESFNLKIRLLNELKDEDESLINFGVKMGYSNAAPVERAQTIKQEVLFIANKDSRQSGPIDVTGKEAKTMAQINEMPPAEREKLKNDLKKVIITLAKEDVTAETTEGNHKP